MLGGFVCEDGLFFEIFDLFVCVGDDGEVVLIFILELGGGVE